MLSVHELYQYQELGYVGPFNIFDAKETNLITQKLRIEKTKLSVFKKLSSYVPNLPWHCVNVNWAKDMHVHSPLVYQLSIRPIILDKVISIVGENLVLWGGLFLNIRPYENPTWHRDGECEKWGCLDHANVWLALNNVDEESGMRLISRSHQMLDIPGGLHSYDHVALEEAKKRDPKCELVSYGDKVKPGDFFIFNGNLWHTGGKNNAKTRYSLLLQYCKSNLEVRMPANPDVLAPCIALNSKSGSFANVN
jgi:hypothetical protein